MWQEAPGPVLRTPYSHLRDRFNTKYQEEFFGRLRLYVKYQVSMEHIHIH